MSKNKATAPKIEYPLPEENADDLHDWEEVYERGLDKLSELYGTDMRKLAEENGIKL